MMTLFYEQNIYPGPSSQTTLVKEVNFIVENTVNLGFFDIYSPEIRRSTKRAWDEAAREVLQEHTELWERLAKR
ncbi:MAG: hypothetical protein JXA37_11345 [Chloroflexia bacterium]|nr:hypothetical protein [Chloroflexia bacterium]